MQKIVFVTGKGGVGKSATAAALALAKSKQGKRTLLVELGYQSFYQDYFRLEKVTYKPTNLKPNLDVALWSGPECLKEYALHLIKIETLYKLFFENPVTKSLIDIAPALSELAILGKITSGHRKIGPPLPYDVIVIDAFATGHFLALLRAPIGMAEVVKFGPMGEQTRSIFQVIEDPEKTNIKVIAIPEELPIVESLELIHDIKTIIKQQPQMILNRCLLAQATADVKTSDFAQYIEHQLQQQKWSLEQIQKAGILCHQVPMVFSLDPWTIIEKLSQGLAND